MAKRSELREKIMTILYQIEMYKKNNFDFNIDNVIKENISISNEFVNDIVKGTISHIDEIDIFANKYLKNWKINRLDNLGASILRMAIYEMLYTDTPKIVIINEAVELSKKYSDESVKNMINAVLQHIMDDE